MGVAKDSVRRWMYLRRWDVGVAEGMGVSSEVEGGCI